MNWKFWKKKEVKVEKVSQLVIYLENKFTISLEQPVERKSQIKSKWIDFYKWYFIRSSDKYCLNYNEGSYLIERCEIAFVQIRYFERQQNQN